MSEMSDIERIRNDLESAFVAFSDRDGVPLRQASNVASLNLFDRLFDEAVEGRRINIDLDDQSSLPLNGFVKSFGVDDEAVQLLTVFVTEKEADFARLWAICKAWLHDGLDAEAALEAQAG